jgi:hypothetical protein
VFDARQLLAKEFFDLGVIVFPNTVVVGKDVLSYRPVMKRETTVVDVELRFSS